MRKLRSLPFALLAFALFAFASATLRAQTQTAPPTITPVNLGSSSAPVGMAPLNANAPSTPALIPRGQYKIRAGDTLSLDFRLSPELNQTVSVDRDGSISLEIIGRVQVGGLTVDQAKALILSMEQQHLVKPEVNLQLTNFQHFYVVVAGEVYIPQKIEMRENLTALQAVMLAGGIKISGRETQVLLYRKVDEEYAEVHKLNLRIKKTVQMENDMSLEPGDLIFVPRNKVESVSRYVRIAGLSYNFQPTAF